LLGIFGHPILVKCISPQVSRHQIKTAICIVDFTIMKHISNTITGGTRIILSLQAIGYLSAKGKIIHRKMKSTRYAIRRKISCYPFISFVLSDLSDTSS